MNFFVKETDLVHGLVGTQNEAYAACSQLFNMSNLARLYIFTSADVAFVFMWVGWGLSVGPPAVCRLIVLDLLDKKRASCS